jgi:hypothetical protein
MNTFAVFVILFILSCGAPQVTKDETTQEKKGDTVAVHDILAKYRESWMQVNGVIGIGEGLDKNAKPCVIIFVESLTPEVEKRIPLSVEGVPLIIEEVGTVTIHK